MTWPEPGAEEPPQAGRRLTVPLEIVLRQGAILVGTAANQHASPTAAISRRSYGGAACRVPTSR
jgi:hypothetical protein